MATQEQRNKYVEEAKKALTRIQEFDVEKLARTDELGRDLNFVPVLPHATKIVDLFKQVSVDVLPDFSEQKLVAIRDLANAEFNRFEEMLKFTLVGANPKATRDQLIQQEENGYDGVFENLWPAIAYSVRRSTDFARLEREARSSIQAIEDKTTDLQATLAKQGHEAEAALDAIRKVAAEQGVSQQAIYFKNEADSHSKSAEEWLKRTVILTVVLAAYAIGSLFLHKWSWLSPENTFEATQLIVSKVLLFSTILFLLALCARNFMSHQHNAVVNRHRQNSLVTYRALVEAAGDDANRDIILSKAADSIFTSEVTGFVKSDGSEGGSLSMVNVSPGMFRAATNG